MSIFKRLMREHLKTNTLKRYASDKDRDRFNYLILIFIVLLEDLYKLSPLNLIFALNVPLLLSFLILNVALPFLLILTLQVLPLTFKVSFLPDLRYFLPLTEDPFIVVRVTVILLIFLLALNFLFLALIIVFFLIILIIFTAEDPLYWSSPENDMVILQFPAFCREICNLAMPLLSVATEYVFPSRVKLNILFAKGFPLISFNVTVKYFPRSPAL